MQRISEALSPEPYLEIAGEGVQALNASSAMAGEEARQVGSEGGEEGKEEGGKEAEQGETSDARQRP